MAAVLYQDMLTHNYTDSSGVSIGTSNYSYGVFDNPLGPYKGSGVLIENNDGTLTFMLWHDDFTGNSGDGQLYFDYFQATFYALNNNGSLDSSVPYGRNQVIGFSNVGTPPSYYTMASGPIYTTAGNNSVNPDNSSYVTVFNDTVAIDGYNVFRCRLHPAGGAGTIIHLYDISHFFNGHTYNGNVQGGPWIGITDLILKYAPVLDPVMTSVTPSTSDQGESAVIKGTNFQTKYAIEFRSGPFQEILQYTYIDSQTATIIAPTDFIGSGTLYMVDPTATPAASTLPFTVVKPSQTVLYSSPSSEVSASFGAAPINLVAGILTINGPDSIVEGQSGTYGAMYLAPGATVPVDVSTQCLWSSLRPASFHSNNGVYYAILPKGTDVVTATYYPYIANPPTVPTVQNPSTVTATASKTIAVIDDRVGTLRISADVNPVRSDSTTNLHVYITNPGLAEAEITGQTVITSTIPGTVKGSVYANPGAQQTGIRDTLTTTTVDNNGNTITATYLMNTIVIFPKILTLIPAQPTVQVGTTKQFIAKEFDPNTNTITYPNATWTTTDISAAGIITSGGLFTATGVGNQVIVNAVATDGSNASASTNVTVTAQAVTTNPAPTLVISPKNPTIQVNDQVQFSVTKTDYQGTVSNPSCQWSVNNVDGSGSITQTGLFTGLRPGSNVQVTAITEDSDAASISTTVHINPLPSVLDFAVIPPSAIVAAGTTQQFSVVATNTNGELIDPIVTWTVTDLDGSGFIDPNSGLFTGEIVGKSVLVTATGPVQPDGTQPTATASVVVTAGSPIRIVVSPPNVQLLISAGQQFSALGYDAYNNAVALTNPAPTWNVIGGIGTTDQTGLFAASTEGLGTITATQNKITGSAQINVLVVIGGAVVTDAPQQPFAKINIRDIINAPTVIDTRVRGGGVKSAAILPTSDDFWWDITNFDGDPFQLYGVYVVNCVPPPGSSVTVNDLNPARITSVLSKYAAPNFLALIMPMGV